jgi:hypothetical protein
LCGISKEQRFLEVVVGKRDRDIILTAVCGLELFGGLTRNGSVYYNVRAKGGITRRRELTDPAFNAIFDALEADGRPLEGLGPEDSLFNISHQTFYAIPEVRQAGRVGRS